MQPLVRWHGHSLVSTHSLGKKLRLRSCSSVWQYACFQPLARWHGESLVSQNTRRTHLSRSVKDHKGNTSLTDLSLGGNKVGDASATALAEAVKATVLTCQLYLFQGMCFLLPQMSRYTVVLAVSVVRFLCNLCVLLLCFSFVSKGSIHQGSNFSKLVWPGSRIAWTKRVSRHRHLLDCSAPSQRVFRTVAYLSNNDRDVVPEGMTWRGRTCHYAVQDVNTISYAVARQNLSLLFVYGGADNDRIVARTGKSDDV